MNEIWPYVGMVAVTAGLVGIRVSQQLNVVRGYFVRAFFTSYAFTFFEGLTVGILAKTYLDQAWFNLFFLATGSAIGGMCSMFFYHRKKG